MALPRRSLRSRKYDSSPKTPRNRMMNRTIRKRREQMDELSGESDFSDESDYELSEDEPDRAAEYNPDIRLNQRKKDSPTKRRNKLYPDLEPLINEEAEEKLKTRRRFGPTPAILILMTILLILSLMSIGHFIFYFINSTSSSTTPKTLDAVASDIKSGLKLLYHQTNQDKSFWTQVLSQLQLLTEVSPSQPAVLLVVVPNGAQMTAACLSHQLLNLVSRAFEDGRHLSFDSESHAGHSPDSVKHYLDDMFRQLSHYHAAAVFNVERLAPEATFMLHAFCDHENAPFKRSFILLTVELERRYEELASSRFDYEVHDLLMKQWTTKLREQDAAAIFSRISNAPVIVKPDNSVKDLCPR